MKAQDRASEWIAEGRSLREVARLFPTKLAAIEYFAATMPRLSPAPNPHCCLCQIECNDPPNAFIWAARVDTSETAAMSLLLTALAPLTNRLHFRWVEVQFTTLHRLCPACDQRFLVRRATGMFIQTLLFAAMLMLLLITVPAVVGVAIGVLLYPRILWPMSLVAIAGLILLALVFLAFERCRRLQIPQSLRHIGRHPFALHALRRTL